MDPDPRAILRKVETAKAMLISWALIAAALILLFPLIQWLFGYSW